LGAGFRIIPERRTWGPWRPGQRASRHPSKRRCGIVAAQESHKESHDDDESNRARWLFPLLLLLCFFISHPVSHLHPWCSTDHLKLLRSAVVHEKLQMLLWWVDSLIDSGKLLLVFSHLFVVPILWVSLEKK
jgi:hypothetical protein